jgi:hypothetical protein
VTTPGLCLLDQPNLVFFDLAVAAGVALESSPKAPSAVLKSEL